MISVLVSVMLNPRGEDIFSAHSVKTKLRYTDALWACANYPLKKKLWTLTQIVCIGKIINNKQNKYKSDVSVCRRTNNPCLLSLSSLICSLQQLPSVWCSAGLNVMLLDFQLSLHVLHSLYNLPVSVWWSSPSDLHCSSLQSVFLLIDRKPQNVCPCTSCFHCVVKVWKDFWMDQWGPRLPRNQRPQSHFYF